MTSVLGRPEKVLEFTREAVVNSTRLKSYSYYHGCCQISWWPA